MATRGRKKLTDKDRAIRGEVVNGVNTPKLLTEMSDPPAYLEPYAQEAWRLLVPILNELGILSRADAISIALFCDTFNVWRQSMETRKQTGLWETTQSGYQQQHAAVSTCMKCVTEMNKMLDKFGLTPAARQRIAIELADATDALALFLARRKG